MLNTLLSTDDSWIGLILRVTVAGILFPHGAQKLLGWFGGPGFDGIMGWLTGTKHLPWIVALAVVLVEFFASLLLLAGFGTRFMAVAVITLMIGIILTSHIHVGFFMNWDGESRPEGYEYHLLIIGLCLAILLSGGGRYSVDKLLVG